MIEKLCRLWRVLAALAIVVPLAARAAEEPPAAPAYTNHLAGERSPYLLQHAHNPVDWYPWGKEAFDKAKKENKPIFLSIGYSTCHWCHVMERESFENPEIAKLINDSFVAIKVDREERPDVDAVYMQFVTAITGEGGWPMTVFLTPDLKPFFGGTYFPPKDRDGIPGLTRIIPGVHAAWEQKHDKVLTSADQLTDKLRDSAMMMRTGTLKPAVADQAFEAFRGQFDVHQGGFGDAPKFPRPVVLNFLFHRYHRTGDQVALDMALQTLRSMAAGGIHDQLGGGFHRYSTDDHWFLPHFEKMLYDQAQLAQSYLDAWQITHDPYFSDTARDILDYVLRDLTGPDGQFYCAEDADSAEDAAHPQEKSEGAFYVWTAAQIRSILGNGPADIVAFRFGALDAGNVEHDARGELKGKNVLYLAHSIPETAKQFGKSEAEITQSLEQSRQKLLASRVQRPRPLRDDKTLVAWNGLMISAMARAGAALQEPRYTNAATRAAEFIEAHLYDPATHHLARGWREGKSDAVGFLDDSSFCIQGLLDLYESSFDIRWLKLALELQQKQDELFWDAKGGGYFQNAGDDPSVLIRLKEDEDNAEPAGNSVAALNLLRLGQMTDSQDLRDRAGKTMDSFGPQIANALTSMPQMLVAFEYQASKPRQIVLAGAAGAPGVLALRNEIDRRYLPDKILLLADGAAGQEFLAGHLPFMKGLAPAGNQPSAYVCENYACQLPVTEPGKLGALLDRPSAAPATKPSGEPTMAP